MLGAESVFALFRVDCSTTENKCNGADEECGKNRTWRDAADKKAAASNEDLLQSNRNQQILQRFEDSNTRELRTFDQYSSAS